MQLACLQGKCESTASHGPTTLGINSGNIKQSQRSGVLNIKPCFADPMCHVSLMYTGKRLMTRKVKIINVLVGGRNKLWRQQAVAVNFKVELAIPPFPLMKG